MPKYKNIKSVIHNWANSLLSLENYDEEGYFIAELILAAKSMDTIKVTIKPLENEVNPSAVKNDRIKKFLSFSEVSLIDLFNKQNVDPCMVENVELEILFDFSDESINYTGISFRDKNLAPLPVRYKAQVIAQDNRKKIYQCAIQEWWR